MLKWTSCHTFFFLGNSREGPYCKHILLPEFIASSYLNLYVSSQILIPSFSLCFYVFLAQLVPRWYEHWTSNLVYDGDMIVLQGQEKIFLAASKESSADVNQQYTKITFTPTQADRFVLAFRTWLRKFGNSQPKWFGNPSQEALPSTVLSKREVKVTMVTKGSQYYFFFLLQT